MLFFLYISFTVFHKYQYICVNKERSDFHGRRPISRNAEPVHNAGGSRKLCDQRLHNYRDKTGGSYAACDVRI